MRLFLSKLHTGWRERCPAEHRSIAAPKAYVPCTGGHRNGALHLQRDLARVKVGYRLERECRLNDSELAYLSAAEQGRLIRARKLSPVELVKNCLARIERYDSVLRAYITVCGDAALEAAREAEAEIGRGNYRGPLHGLPFGVKDQLC